MSFRKLVMITCSDIPMSAANCRFISLYFDASDRFIIVP